MYTGYKDKRGTQGLDVTAYYPSWRAQQLLPKIEIGCTPPKCPSEVCRRANLLGGRLLVAAARRGGARGGGVYGRNNSAAVRSHSLTAMRLTCAETLAPHLHHTCTAGAVQTGGG